MPEGPASNGHYVHTTVCLPARFELPDQALQVHGIGEVRSNFVREQRAIQLSDWLAIHPRLFVGDLDNVSLDPMNCR